MPLLQEQHALITCVFDVYGSTGVWDRFEGGEIDSETRQYRAGGMAAPEALPGAPTVSDITISRGYRSERDAALERWLVANIGEWATVGKQALDRRAQPIPGGLINFRCVLKGITTPTVDSEGTEVQMLSVVFTVDGLPS